MISMHPDAEGALTSSVSVDGLTVWIVAQYDRRQRGMGGLGSGRTLGCALVELARKDINQIEPPLHTIVLRRVVVCKTRK